MKPDFHILLVEDSRADVIIIERALTERNLPFRLTVLSDGNLALEHLSRLTDPRTIDDPSLQPDLVLLDLNLPGIDGCQVLTRLKAHPILRSIPVVVLTTSRDELDVYQTYQAGANSYIQKPCEYPRYLELVESLRTYWYHSTLRPPLFRPGR